MAKNVLVLKHFESPKEAGVYHRLVCLTGQSKGESYVLMGNRIVLGRSDKADIRVNDIKASREHAEFTKVGDSWVVTDLGSQNGVVVNDRKITQVQLKESDKVIIGHTVYKFARVEVANKDKVIREKNGSNSTNKKTLVPLLGLILILTVLFLFGEDAPKENTSESKNTSYNDVSNEYLVALKKRQENENKAVKEKLTVIYQRGLREFREGNYYRAIHEFNLALIMAPGDSQAEFYLRKTKEQLDKAIDDNIAKAQRDKEALKYRSAIKNYCAIIRLLYSVPDDPRHKDAVKQIEELEAKLGMDKGETDCLKKSHSNS